MTRFGTHGYVGVPGSALFDDIARMTPHGTTGYVGPTGAGWVGDAGAAARYARIIGTDDVASLARNANVPESLIASVKQHLFVTEHRIPVGPDQWRIGRFHPSHSLADLWEAAARGERSEEFRNLLGHEYLESTLMKHLNVPYLSPHPDAWIDPSDWTSMPTRSHFGAHDLSPNPWTGDLSEPQLEMWEEFMKGISERQ